MATVQTGFAGFVAWQLFDGRTMVGTPDRTIPAIGGRIGVRRWDGSQCTPVASEIRPATEDDCWAADKVFSGK